jgi:hypothetical protein
MPSAYLPDDNPMLFERFTNPSQIEKDLRNFSAQLQGIQSDLDINSPELTYIMTWYEDHQGQRLKEPYKELIDLMDEIFRDGVITLEEVNDMIWFCDVHANHENAFYCMKSRGLQSLIGIVDGMNCDKELNITELEFLFNWMNENEHLKNNWPFDELYSLILKVTADGIIEKAEHDELISFCQYMVTGSSDNDLVPLTGFFQVDPLIQFTGKSFCFTGNSHKAKRRELEDLVYKCGGRSISKVSSKLDYLVVCEEHSRFWAYSCYGRKIEEAMAIRKSGLQLLIVSEIDFFDAMEGFR